MNINYDAWHSGAPPSDGWWPASIYFTKGSLRWRGNGIWSTCALYEYDTAEKAGRIALEPEAQHRQAAIKWQHRPKNWPAKSRT